MKISHADLLKILSYDQETGLFTWRIAVSNVAAGAVCNCLNSAGYRVIRIGGRLYTANRLAFFFVMGKWPRDQHVVDHINGDRADDRWSNLREVSYAENTQRGRARKNKSGRRGVIWAAQSGKWQARIKVDGRVKHLGFFSSVDEAAYAYDAAATKHYSGLAGTNFSGAQ